MKKIKLKLKFTKILMLLIVPTGLELYKYQLHKQMESLLNDGTPGISELLSKSIIVNKILLAYVLLVLLYNLMKEYKTSSRVWSNIWNSARVMKESKMKAVPINGSLNNNVSIMPLWSSRVVFCRNDIYF